MKITDYWLATGLDSEELIEEVTELLAEGWQPLGGISHSVVDSKNDHSDWYTQAMVKYAPEPRSILGRNATTGEPIYSFDWYTKSEAPKA